MKRVIFFLLLNLLASFAQSAEPSEYPKAVSGWLIRDLISKDRFELSPGSLLSCTESSYQSFIQYECSLGGAVFTVSREGNQTQSIRFTRLVLTDHRGELKGYRDLQFHGEWIDERARPPLQSRAYLLLRQNRAESNRVWGSVNLDRYGLAFGIEGRAE